jgi:hypothetical protein
LNYIIKFPDSTIVFFAPVILSPDFKPQLLFPSENYNVNELFPPSPTGLVTLKAKQTVENIHAKLRIDVNVYGTNYTTSFFLFILGEQFD